MELHGSVHRNICQSCGKLYTAEYIIQTTGIPHCTCGGIIKPDVVLYEEALNGDVMNRSVRLISESDVLIVGGTSLNVYPAAGLIDYYRGNQLILINVSSTPFDHKADLIIHDKIGEVFSQINLL